MRAGAQSRRRKRQLGRLYFADQRMGDRHVGGEKPDNPVAPSKVWFANLLALPGIRLAEMPPDLLIDSRFLPGDPPKDPADRIVAATSRAYGFTLVTRDGELVPYGRAGHLKVINC